MTRFWITLDECVNFTLQCFERMVGGEIFVPKLQSVKIIDLARAICPECKLKFVGIRPGEKINETLIPIDDARNTVEFDDHYLVKPAFRFFLRRFSHDNCRPVKEDFEYNSGNNTWWLSRDELRSIIDNLGLPPIDD